jgi:hypothetical protein
MNSDALFTHPDLQQVQVEALTAFYLLSTDQINRYDFSPLFFLSLHLTIKQCMESCLVGSSVRYISWS